MERMWKKIPRPNRGRDSQIIGNPVLVGSSLDKDRLERMPQVGTAQNHQTNQPPPRFYADSNRKNAVSVAPSVYGAMNQGGRPPVASSYYGDVSPPDSPRNHPANMENSGDVSPIEKHSENDIHPAFRINQKPSNSNLPIPRRQVTPNSLSSPASRAYNRDPSKPIKWDKYTGEPTTSQKGLPPGVMPGNVITGLEQTRLKRVGDRPAPSVDRPLSVETRPPWKGGSGRSAIVDPVKDKPSERHPIEHRKQQALPSPPPSSSPNAARRELPMKAETRGASNAPAVQPPEETSSPVAPSSNERGQSKKINTETPMPNIARAYPSPPLGADDRGATISQSPAASESLTRGSSDIVRGSSKRTDSTTVNIDSRFSWTTQATNTSYQPSPPPSPPPPLPTTIPLQYTSPIPNAASILNRKRPVASTRNYSPDPESPIISNPGMRRRTTGQGIRNDGSESPQSSYPVRTSSRAPSIASTTTGGGKALPPTPGQLNSLDHVGELQAQLDDLTIQKYNIQRVLRDLTAPEASNPLKTNFLVERERVKRVTALRDELNEIGMLEHDIGVRLHRANKKRERDEGYEGFTTLWVRRVTS